MASNKRKRGRQKKYDDVEVANILNKYLNSIFHLKIDNTIGVTSKTEDCRGHKIYCYVSNNVGNFRKNYEEMHAKENIDQSYDETFDLSKSSVSENNVTLEETNVTFSVDREEFHKILERCVYKCKDSNSGTREYFSFKPYNWTSFMNRKIREAVVGLTCVYYDKRHNLNEDHTGNFNGTCKCQSTVQGYIHNFMASNVLISCTIVKGNEDLSCGKEYLRGEERFKIGKPFFDSNLHPSVYRNEKAADLKKGEKEPPDLPKVQALANAKSSYKKSLQRHKSVYRGIQNLKANELKDDIHFILSDPFSVHFWSYHQMDVYRFYVKKMVLY